MRHERFVPMEYVNQELMDELNEFMIRLKVQLFNLPINRPKLEVDEIDNLQMRINEVLKVDSKPMVRY